MLENAPADTKLILHALHKDGLQFDSRVVTNKDDFIVAIHAYKPHIILSDHTLPNFDSMEALETARKANIKAPFILVTGTVSEEFAVSIIKSGAADYILKDNLSRLTVAILSALSQQQDRDKQKEHQHQFQHTIDQMVDGVQIIGYDWTYIYANNIVAEQSRRTTGELFGRTVMEIYPNLVNTPVFTAFRQCMEDRELVEMENEFFFADGSSEWFKLIMQPVPPGVLILSHQITAEKRNLLLLESQNERIKMINAAMDRFLYSVSHEFRTPICNGLGLINLLRNKLSENERTDILNKLEISIKSLDEMLQNIGIFSEITSQDTAPESINMQQVFSFCLSQVKALKGRENVSISLKIARDDQFVSDKRRLSIVLTNLISNGIKFRDQRKKSFIDVIVIASGSTVKIEVRDNGIGIKEHDIERVFDVFYTTDELKMGYGLGLYMVREIITKLGGTITVKSQYDIGTTFCITLPNGRDNVKAPIKEGNLRIA